ncbi:hypothetical protein PQZ42_02460 [Alphaproteobacteria bacterium]|nr:hypothetical protein [Alphaproteobacteria bacterium]
MARLGWSDFVIWQCSLRQRNFRMFGGKPSEGTIASLSDLKLSKELCDIRTVLIEKNCINTAKMFEFMSKQTNEAEIRFDKIVKFLSSEYYNTPTNFDGSFTATFNKNSELYKKISKKKKLGVQFFERGTGFNFPVNISKLKKIDAKWQYTFWHNSFFNNNLNENIEIVYFSPIKNKIEEIL